MVKTKGPMMSVGASGTLADAITFSNWKGRSYVRKRSTPANPQTGAQVGRRALMSFLAKQWSAISTADKNTWQQRADQLSVAPYHAFISDNLEEWHNFLAPTDTSPAARILNPSDNALTDAAWEQHRIKLNILGTAINDGWGILIFAEDFTPFVPTVSNCIIAARETTVANHLRFWTPPILQTWNFMNITFSTDGKQSAPTGAQQAVPP